MTFFINTVLQKLNHCGLKGLEHEVFENRFRFSRDIRISNISADKSIPLMLSLRLNVFRVCSASDGNSFPVCSAYFE